MIPPEVLVALDCERPSSRLCDRETSGGSGWAAVDFPARPRSSCQELHQGSERSRSDDEPWAMGLLMSPLASHYSACCKQCCIVHIHISTIILHRCRYRSSLARHRYHKPASSRERSNAGRVAISFIDPTPYVTLAHYKGRGELVHILIRLT
jgi:hypothetical protein